MAYDHAATKRLRAKTVHDTLAVCAEYYDDSMAGPQALRVRWHNKMALHGDINKDGYSQYIDSSDRVIFSLDELFIKGLVIVRGGVVKMDDGQVLHIDSRDETAGPGEEIWLVGKG